MAPKRRLRSDLNPESDVSLHEEDEQGKQRAEATGSPRYRPAKPPPKVPVRGVATKPHKPYTNKAHFGAAEEFEPRMEGIRELLKIRQILQTHQQEFQSAAPITWLYDRATAVDTNLASAEREEKAVDLEIARNSSLIEKLLEDRGALERLSRLFDSSNTDQNVSTASREAWEALNQRILQISGVTRAEVENSAQQRQTNFALQRHVERLEQEAHELREKVGIYEAAGQENNAWIRSGDAEMRDMGRTIGELRGQLAAVLGKDEGAQLLLHQANQTIEQLRTERDNATASQQQSVQDVGFWRAESFRYQRLLQDMAFEADGHLQECQAHGATLQAELEKIMGEKEALETEALWRENREAVNQSLAERLQGVELERSKEQYRAEEAEWRVGKLEKMVLDHLKGKPIEAQWARYRGKTIQSWEAAIASIIPPVKVVTKAKSKTTTPPAPHPTSHATSDAFADSVFEGFISTASVLPTVEQDVTMSDAPKAKLRPAHRPAFSLAHAPKPTTPQTTNEKDDGDDTNMADPGGETAPDEPS